MTKACNLTSHTGTSGCPSCSACHLAVLVLQSSVLKQRATLDLEWNPAQLLVIRLCTSCTASSHVAPEQYILQSRQMGFGHAASFGASPQILIPEYAPCCKVRTHFDIGTVTM